MEIKNNLTVTRGEGGGDNGCREEFSGTTIKDTWTKPRRGGSEGGKWGWLGWWVNADNCN